MVDRSFDKPVDLEKRYVLKNLLPTLSGCSALALWSLTALLSVELINIPPFLLTGVMTSCFFLITLCKIALKRRWSVFRQSLSTWLIGATTFTAFNVFYHASFKLAPAATVDLINYLWPIMVVVVSSFLPGERFTKRHALSALLGFISLYILIGYSPVKMHSKELLGCFFAFIGALSWTAFNLFLSRDQTTNGDVLGLFAGLTAAICFIFHFICEPFTIPSQREWLQLLFIGFFVCGSTYTLWNYGIKRGSIKQLSIYSYFTPVASISFLVAFGKSELTNSLFISTGLITFASTIPALIKKITEPNTLPFNDLV
ncbi:MAG: DMT family transporter [Simkaniaceae bacterium]|nr:DMT family transporter [Simkaniaceae bacterium]